MPNNRDDFTDTTIRKAASRVGYRCSYPNCKNATVGASMETSDKVSVTGVAAHICAAAKGGPRYDESMTKEERRSVENCIWLCQTHARLIDTDVSKYTVELLRKWKNDAEIQASLALADAYFFDNYYSANGDNLHVFEELLEGMIADGNYDKVIKLLEQYKNNLSEYYEEIVLRYKIVYDIYCDRKQLEKDLNKYILLPIKSGVDKIIELLISFSLLKELEKILEFCSNDELNNIAKDAIDGKLIEKLFVPHESADTFKCSPQYLRLAEQVIANYSFSKRMYTLKNLHGEYFDLHDGNFFYEIQSQIFNLARFFAFKNELPLGPLKSIKNNLNKIIMLDFELQCKLFSCLLQTLVSSPNEYMQVYEACPHNVKNYTSIKEIHYIFIIDQQYEKINVEEILAFSNENNLYFPVHLYLSTLQKSHATRFLDEHQFLYAKDSYFIYTKYLLSGSQKTADLNEILKRYSSDYEENFIFTCIKLFIAETEEECDLLIGWLENYKNLNGLIDNELVIYIDALNKRKRWTELYNLSKIATSNFIIYKITCALHSSQNKEFLPKCKSLYMFLIDNGYRTKGLFYNYGIIQLEMNELENAKINFQQEYDSHKEECSLIALLNTRYLTGDFKDDSYLDAAKKSINSQLQNLAGAILEKLENWEDARKYILRSLLIDESNLSCVKGLYFICSNLKDNNSTRTNINTVCLINNGKERLKIAIHAPEILEGIKPNSFADCIHLSSENAEISKLLFAVKGDVIELFNDMYTLEEITPLNVYLSQLSFSQIIQSPDTIKIEGETPEDAIKNITEFMRKESEKTHNIINEYNSASFIYPLSSLSKMMGKSMLNCCEFLAYGNTSKIRNNTKSVLLDLTNTTMVLSYDSIIFMHFLGVADDIFLTNTNCVCSKAIIQQILNDISNELASLTSETNVGIMTYEDGELKILEHDKTSRGVRYQNLIKLKEFVNKIPTSENLDYHFRQDYMEDFFVQEKLYCEKNCIALTKSLKNGVLLSDDQFLYTLSDMEGVSCVGLCSFLSLSVDSWRKLLNYILNLAKINFASYFTLDLYKKVLSLIDADTENQADGNNALTKVLLSDNDDSPASDYHKNVIIELFRAYIAEDERRLISGNTLHRIAIKHFSSLNPDIIKQILQDAIKEIQFAAETSDN